jgi:hypothetical protein
VWSAEESADNLTYRASASNDFTPAILISFRTESPLSMCEPNIIKESFNRAEATATATTVF